MPNYRYMCEKKHEIPVNHSIYENPEITCPKCKGAMQRKPATIVARFKGEGFASNDK